MSRLQQDQTTECYEELTGDDKQQLQGKLTETGN